MAPAGLEKFLNEVSKNALSILTYMTTLFLSRCQKMFVETSVGSFGVCLPSKCSCCTANLVEESAEHLLISSMISYFFNHLFGIRKGNPGPSSGGGILEIRKE